MEEEQKKKIGVGIGVVIFKDGKVLLGHRHDDPKKASSELHGEGTWTMPGGKIHFGETYQEAAYREVKEETGLEINPDKLKIICINNDILPDVHFVTIGLLAEEIQGEPKVLEPDEITEWKWFDMGQLPFPIFESSAKVLIEYRKKNS